MALVPRIAAWLGARLPAAAVAHFLEKKDVPVHRGTPWYYLGGMAVFLIGVQAVTGVLLLFYYRPTPEAAFESVRFISAEVRFGWLIRSVHGWAADLLIGVILVHLASTYFMKAYRPPRELTWMTGVGLLVLMMGFGFSGYLLPWNQLAFFATKVGTQMAGAVPGAGPALLRLLRGGDEVTGATLNRFFAVHVAVLPAALAVLMGAHLLLVQKLGMSVPPGEELRSPLRRMPFFPNFFLRDLIGWLLMLAALAILSALVPRELGEKADPFAPAPEGIKPEWYFLLPFQTLKLIPARLLGLEGETAGILGFGAAGIILVLVPFLDRKASRGEKSPGWTLLGVLGAAFFLVMTVWGWMSR